MRISDWSSDVCSSDLHARQCGSPDTLSPRRRRRWRRQAEHAWWAATASRSCGIELHAQTRHDLKYRVDPVELQLLPIVRHSHDGALLAIDRKRKRLNSST